MRWRPFDRKPFANRTPFTDHERFENRTPTEERTPFEDRTSTEDREPTQDRTPFEDHTPTEDRTPIEDHEPAGRRRQPRRSGAERRHLMAAEPPILDEFRRLRARVPQLTGALAAGVDGLVLAHDTPGVEPDGLAALTAAALGVAVRMTDATGRGDFRELLIRGANGYVATYAAGRTAVLTLLAQDGVNVGRLHLEGRRAGARIGELVDAEVAPPGRSPAKAADKAPAKSSARDPAKAPAAARTKSARTARSTTTNPRTYTDS